MQRKEGKTWAAGVPIQRYRQVRGVAPCPDRWARHAAPVDIAAPARSRSEALRRLPLWRTLRACRAAIWGDMPLFAAVVVRTAGPGACGCRPLTTGIGEQPASSPYRALYGQVTVTRFDARRQVGMRRAARSFARECSGERPRRPGGLASGDRTALQSRTSRHIGIMPS